MLHVTLACRARTQVFVYLNDLADADGGRTHFPLLDLAVAPVCGSALVWSNIDKRGALDGRTRHAGQPVARQGVVKWGMNIWLRQRPFCAPSAIGKEVIGKDAAFPSAAGSSSISTTPSPDGDQPACLWIRRVSARAPPTQTQTLPVGRTATTLRERAY